MQANDISKRFEEFAGKEKFEKFLTALSTTCKKHERLLYWQEKLWDEFQQSNHLNLGNTYSEISRIFDSEIQRMDEKIQERIKEERSKHPIHFALLTTNWEAIGAGATAGAVAGLAAMIFAEGKLTFPIFIAVYLLMLAQFKGARSLISLISFVIVGSLFLAFMNDLAVGGLSGWLENLLSEAPIPPPRFDSLHGISDPAELNRQINSLLVAGQSHLRHDESLSVTLGLVLMAACLLSLLGAVVYVIRLRKRSDSLPSALRLTFVIGILAIIPIALACGIKLAEENILLASSVAEAISNNNTSPSAVSPGDRIRVDIPVKMKSFFGYHEVASFSLDAAMAHLTNGNRAPVVLGDPELKDGGRKPDTTDLIPLMETVEPRMSVTLPPESQFSGSIISLSVSGNLRIIPKGQRYVESRPRHFEATTTFRVMNENEIRFTTAFEAVSGRMTAYVIASFIIGVLVACVILIFKPKARDTSQIESAK